MLIVDLTKRYSCRFEMTFAIATTTDKFMSLFCRTTMVGLTPSKNQSLIDMIALLSAYPCSPTTSLSIYVLPSVRRFMSLSLRHHGKNHTVVGERMPVKSPHLHGCGRNESVRHWLDLRTCQEKVDAFVARTPPHHCSQWMHKCLQHWTCHLRVCLHVTANACIIMLNKHA